MLKKIDNRYINSARDEIICVTGVRDDYIRMPYFLDYYRKLGVNRFIFIDNCSLDGTADYILSQPDCHCFRATGSHFEFNIWPPRWSNAILNSYADDRWCVVVDSDELLVYDCCEEIGLHKFCANIHNEGHDAVPGFLIDMYNKGPLRSIQYQYGDSYVDHTPYFDAAPGWTVHHQGYPHLQMFGGVRERVFWKGRVRNTLPPCLSKSPVIRWQRGMRYLVAQHTINKANPSFRAVALLHFKFLVDFYDKTKTQYDENSNLGEKTVQERSAYIDEYIRNPDLSLWSDESVKYINSRQLEKLGWIY